MAYVVEGRRASRHREITERAWADIDAVLPGAREIAGTFPRASGPNCFGAVLTAAGVDGAREEWMQREPIEAWLRERTRLLPRHDTDDGLGVVHVWRNPDGPIDHAALRAPQAVVRMDVADQGADDAGTHDERPRSRAARAPSSSAVTP